MAIRWLLVAAALAAAATPGAVGDARSQPIPPGAVACGGCHPRAPGAAIVPLAGMPAESIAASMRAFRTGERPATVMDRIAKGFSDDEVTAIAAWFARENQP